MSVNNYIISGPNGVGKSAIIETLVTARPDVFARVKGSTVLKNCLGVTTYDELRGFTDEHKNKAFNEAMMSIMEQGQSGGADGPRINLIDAHLLYFDRGEVSKCVMPWTSKVDGIAAVEARSDIMLSRIQSDSVSGVRERSILPERSLSAKASATLLRLYASTNKGFAHDFGQQHGIPVIDIDNSTSRREAAQQLLSGFKIDAVLEPAEDELVA